MFSCLCLNIAFPPVMPQAGCDGRQWGTDDMAMQGEKAS